MGRAVRKLSKKSNRPRAKSMLTSAELEVQPLLSSDISRTSLTEHGFIFKYDSETSDLENNKVPTQTKANELLYPYYLRSFSLDYDIINRPKFYRKLQPYIPLGDTITTEPYTQSSLVTIFAIWNTIMGTSLLAMPWGVERSGLIMGLVLMFFIAGLCLYSANCILNVQVLHGNENGEVAQLSKKLLGPWAAVIAKLFSFVILLGANICYWILMSNFLYYSVNYLHDLLFAGDNTIAFEFNSTNLLCPSNAEFLISANSPRPFSLYEKIWDLHKTVPIFLVLIVAPLLNFKSATFFTKFNSLGTLSVLYLFLFVVIKSYSWGINLSTPIVNGLPDISELYKNTFPATSGILTLSLFIHNIVITIMRNNENQKHNGRDLTIAYMLVLITYLLIGITFYVCFPLAKSCIEDNFLNNFPSTDVFSIVARVFLFFQLLTVYPLISYMLRVQIFAALELSIYPSVLHVVALNCFVVSICILFAIFLPHIGTVIRFSGAICGFVYIYTLPTMLHLASQRSRNLLSAGSVLFHVTISIIGLANLIAQFFV
ncbi:sodium-coupled neutral amino acid transporter 9-like [Daktulosphaira vitifoliae]|uniref:sodium-coupled neutral amino acid transporter 9-like n=1 Tax=Daktulosphaira vitifoliae TaxID=58002 RepID=UPI0021AAB60C|nr:sodium-coupled neutral amino acid transporter 9-like [Daktulosphaira vitifoliae]